MAAGVMKNQRRGQFRLAAGRKCQSPFEPRETEPCRFGCASGGVLFGWVWAWQRTALEQAEVHLSICLQRSAGVHRSEKQQDVEEASTPQNGTFRR